MVHFVGAGPGGPDLITLRGAELLGRADCVVYAGSLVNPALLGLVREGVPVYNSAQMTLEQVLEVLEDRPIQYTYPLEMPLKDKINAIATKIYRADGVNYSAAASKTLAELTEMGYGDLPVCIAKTQYSFSDNAKLTGAPTGFTMEVREVRLAAGAGFVVVICGSIMTMPGLPKKPAAVGIDVDADGKITGLF